MEMVLITSLIVYYWLLLHFRVEYKGYYDEIPLKRFKIFMLIPFSHWIYSLYTTIKEAYQK